MKKFFKILFIVIAIICILVVGAATFSAFSKPEDIRAYSRDDMETWITEQANEKSTTAMRNYDNSADDIPEILQDMGQIIDDTLYGITKNLYEVDTITYDVVNDTTYLVASLNITYRGEYEDIQYVEDDMSAVNYVIGELEAGYTEDISFRTAPGWNEKRFFNVITAAINNCANLAVCPNDYSYYMGMDDIEKENFFFFSFVFPVEQEKRDALNKELKAAIDDIEASVRALDITDTEQLYYALAEQVLDAAEYDYDMPELMQTETRTENEWIEDSAYGALVMGKTVCSGYALAFKALCERFDLPCWVASGFIDNGAHAWNMIKINDETFYTDCTFADGSGDSTWLMLDQEMWEAAEYFTSVNAVKPW